MMDGTNGTSWILEERDYPFLCEFVFDFFFFLWTNHSSSLVLINAKIISIGLIILILENKSVKITQLEYIKTNRLGKS